MSRLHLPRWLTALSMLAPLPAMAQILRPQVCTQDFHPPTNKSQLVPNVAIADYFAFEPAVMPTDRVSTSPVVVRVQVSGAQAATLQLSNGGASLPMLDDGVSPDLVAGDGNYATFLPVAEVLIRNLANRVNRPIIGQIVITETGGAAGPAVNAVYAVAPTGQTAYAITSIASDIQRTDYIFNIRDDAFFADFSHERVLQRVYGRTGDYYDFVNVIYAPRNYVRNRFYARVRNAVQGIGVPIVNGSSAIGSAGRALGYSVFPNLPFYDGANKGAMHELGHQWINRLSGPLADSTGGAHWGTGAVAQAIMGRSGQGGQGISQNCSFNLVPGGVSTTSELQQKQFNFYELYLMGLASTSELPSTFVFSDPVAALAATSGNFCNGQVLTLATTAIDASSIVTSNGARVPSSVNSQKSFNVLNVVISGERLLDPVELRFFSELARRGEVTEDLLVAEGLVSEVISTFYGATRGRAQLDTRVDGVFRGRFE
jgi:hypothetical protein